MLQSKTVRKYDTYKDSGIEWIGEIPQAWCVRKVKTVSDICGRIGFKGYTVNDLVDRDTDGAAIVLGGTNIMKDGYISYEHLTYISEFKYLESPEIMLHGGEILITKVGAGTGENAIYDYVQDRVTINPNVMLCKPDKIINSRFLNYFLLSPNAKNEIYLESNKSGAQPAINQNYIKNLYMTYPAIDEQQAIADYLDKKCGEIDKVVEVEKSVIEKLKEYKQSIITEAVTKGLDKSVPLKDSGIEWIGKIHQHWEVTSIKNVIKGIKDGTHGTFERVSDGEYLLSAKNVFEDGIHIENESLISTEDYNSIISNGYPKKGDILICCVGTIGRCCIYKEEKSIAFQRSVSFLRTKDTISNKFLLYLLKSNSTQIQLNQMANASAQAGIYMGALKNIKVVFVDDYKEQEIIATYLDKKCSEIDKAIADKEQLIEKFTEYKKSLIYECVTGKRKVVA